LHLYSVLSSSPFLKGSHGKRCAKPDQWLNIRV
jgi:hypothetical protein